MALRWAPETSPSGSSSLLQQIQTLRPGQVPALTARTSSPAYTSPGFRASAPAGSAASGAPVTRPTPAPGATPMPTPASTPASGLSSGGGAGGDGGGGSPFATPDFFAGDATLASAFAMNSPQADRIQGYQADQSASVARMSTPPQSQGKQLESDVWVTVPVDKVQVANGRGTITPLYADAKGYREPASGNRIPPVVAAGRQQ